MLRRLILLLVLGAAIPASAQQQLATYPNTVHTRIGSDLVVDGQYYRMAYFTTKDSIQTVAHYFYDLWKNEGYPVTLDGDQKTEIVVSSFYTREGLQRSIVLREHAGKTLGFTVLKDLWLTAPQKNAPALVTLEGTMFAQDMSSRDPLSSMIHRTAMVQTDLYEARKRTVAEYEKKGFALDREIGNTRDGNPMLLLEFSRGQEQVSVELGRVDEGYTAMSQTAVVTRHEDTAPNATARDAMRIPKQKKAGEKKP